MYLRFYERVGHLKRNLSRETGKFIYKHVYIVDLKETGITSVKTAKNIVGSVIGTAQTVYPETAFKIFIVNTGWSFRMIWAIVGFFIDKQTHEKIKILGTDWIKTVTKSGISLDQIPREWGGKG